MSDFNHMAQRLEQDPSITGCGRLLELLVNRRASLETEGAEFAMEVVNGGIIRHLSEHPLNTFRVFTQSLPKASLNAGRSWAQQEYEPPALRRVSLPHGENRVELLSGFVRVEAIDIVGARLMPEQCGAIVLVDGVHLGLAVPFDSFHRTGSSRVL